MDRLLNIIRKLEGGYVHTNTNELSSTSSYGVYYYAHKNKDTCIAIFNYYNDILEKHYKDRNTSFLYTKEELDIINTNLDVVYESILHTHFYNEYLYRIDKHLHNFQYTPLKLYIYATYINNNKIPVRALQQYLNNNAFLAHYKDKLNEDGILGTNTVNRLNELYTHLQTDMMKEQMVYNLNNYTIAQYKSLNTPYTNGYINRVNHTLNYIFNSNKLIDNI